MGWLLKIFGGSWLKFGLVAALLAGFLGVGGYAIHQFKEVGRLEAENKAYEIALNAYAATVTDV